MRASDAHSVLLGDTIAAIMESGMARRTTRFRLIRSPPNHAASTNGKSRAKLPPQSLVNTNGADGRGTGKPRNDWIWAVLGWTRLATKELLWKCLGMSLAISVVICRWGRARPRKPPPTTTSQKTTMARTTARSGSTRFGALKMYRPKIGAEQ